MFTLHQINAFEDSGFLVMDMCCGDDGEIIGDFTLENLRRESEEEIDKVNGFRLGVSQERAAQVYMLVYKIETNVVLEIMLR